MRTKEIIKTFLEEIKEDILMIDGGCPLCINDFVEGINETLKNYDLEIEASENRPMALQIKELSKFEL